MQLPSIKEARASISDSELEHMNSMKEMVEKWGGGEKGLHMALTLRKLQNAQLKGKKEVQWQKYVVILKSLLAYSYTAIIGKISLCLCRELTLMDKDDEFAERRR